MRVTPSVSLSPKRSEIQFNLLIEREAGERKGMRRAVERHTKNVIQFLARFFINRFSLTHSFAVSTQFSLFNIKNDPKVWWNT